MKKYLRSLAALVLLFAAGLGYALREIHTIASQHRELVQQELQKFVGKEVRFDALDLSILGGVGISAENVQVADDSRFAATPLIRARELLLGVSVWNLLLGRIVIDSLTLKDPEFQIITNETGALNLGAIDSGKHAPRRRAKVDAAAVERKAAALGFRIAKLKIRGGRIDYIDRSVTAPAELSIRNFTMTVAGFDPRGTTHVDVRAAITEGISQDIVIEGTLGKIADGGAWLDRPADFTLQFDSLYVPLVARAVAALRDKIPRELDVTGPMALHANLAGTLKHPQLRDVKLKIPLFGASDYNATITGSIDFAAERWSEALLTGKLSTTDVDLQRLRSFRLLRHTLPAALATSGQVRLAANFIGTWDKLRIGVMVDISSAELSFAPWLAKPNREPAHIKLGLARHTDLWAIHPSELNLNGIATTFSGILRAGQGQRLKLRFERRRGPITALAPLMTQSPLAAVSGDTAWDLVVSKGLRNESQWSVHGQMQLSNVELRHKASDRHVQNINGHILFNDNTAHIENATFTTGSSRFKLNASWAPLGAPFLVFELAAPTLQAAELPGLVGLEKALLKDFAWRGQVTWENAQPVLSGMVTATQAQLQEFPVSELRSIVEWSAEGIKFRDLQATGLGGSLRSAGFWHPRAGKDDVQYRHESKLQNAELQTLLTRVAPFLKDRLTGKLDISAAIVSNRTAAHNADNASGTGQWVVRQGEINNFNIFAYLLMRGRNAALSAENLPRLPESLVLLLQRKDSRFESLTGDFELDKEKVTLKNLVLLTPDYSIAGNGWIGFDRTTNWSGVLVLSSQLTRQLQSQYKMIRYILDRKGRLAIPFKVEGKIPSFQINVNNRAFEQALDGIAPRLEEPAKDRPRTDPKQGDGWLPETLDRLIRR